MGNAPTKASSELFVTTLEEGVVPNYPTHEAHCGHYGQGDDLDSFRKALKDKKQSGCYFEVEEQEWYHLFPPEYEPIALNADLLKWVSAPDRVLSIAEFCDEMLRLGVRRTRVFRVQIREDVILIFEGGKSRDKLFISHQAHPGCFSLHVTLDANPKYSELKWLLFDRHCPRVRSLGSALLHFTDKLNQCLGLAFCKLENSSYFLEQHNNQEFKLNANCAYSQKHHGLTYYMSRGYLVTSESDLPDKDMAIELTNRQITRWSQFWLQRTEASEAEVRQLCANLKSEGVEHMVKFYEAPAISIYTPINPFAPAFVYMGQLDPERVKLVEEFDYATARENLQKFTNMPKTRANKEELIRLLLGAEPFPDEDELEIKVLQDIAPANRRKHFRSSGR